MAERRIDGTGVIKVRGTQDGLIVHLPSDVPFTDILGDVRSAIDSAGSFFANAEIVLDFGTRTPNIEEIVALTSLLSERGVALRTVTSSIASHRETLRSWGYQPLRVVPDRPGLTMPEGEPAPGVERQALYVKRTLRSGASVHSNDDVIVLGDVNAGAEVFAGGDVIVWGALRGTVHAGMNGDYGAMICALQLTPTQLRIGGIYARPPDARDSRSVGPMIARVDAGDLVVDSWRHDRRR